MDKYIMEARDRKLDANLKRNEELIKEIQAIPTIDLGPEDVNKEVSQVIARLC